MPAMSPARWQPSATTPVYVYCPEHEDTHRPSMRVYPNGATCFTCGAYVNRVAFSRPFRGERHTLAKLLARSLDRSPRKTSTINPKAAALAFRRLLPKNPEKLDRL